MNGGGHVIGEEDPIPVDGHIDYCELSGTDLVAMKRFYEAAFGWRFTDYGPTYSAFSESGVGGGIDGDPAASGRAPLIVLYADDLEAMLGKVIAAGGTTPERSSPSPVAGASISATRRGMSWRCGRRDETAPDHR